MNTKMMKLIKAQKRAQTEQAITDCLVVLFTMVLIAGIVLGVYGAAIGWW